MHVTSLHIHPLKSGAIQNLNEARLDRFGLENDRHMMVMDRDGMFLTQRALPQLAKVRTDLYRGQLHFADASTPIDIAWSEKRLTAKIWKTSADVSVATDDVNAVLSQWLGHQVLLARIADEPNRFASANWAPAETPMALQDGYPILVACTASLDALNEAICKGPSGPDAQIPMNRFRPNIVVETDEPWVEDTWRHIRVGDVELKFLKPCQRCVLTTQDQMTGVRKNNEPSRTLMELRRSAHPEQKGLMFAWNAVRLKGERLKVGDRVQVLADDPAGWPIK
jgi:hypothetical protein